MRSTRAIVMILLSLIAGVAAVILPLVHPTAPFAAPVEVAASTQDRLSLPRPKAGRARPLVVVVAGAGGGSSGHSRRALLQSLIFVLEDSEPDLLTLIRKMVEMIDDAEALQDVFSMLGMIVYQRAVRDYALMHPAGSA